MKSNNQVTLHKLIKNYNNNKYLILFFYTLEIASHQVYG